jgi:hypothetical protein
VIGDNGGMSLDVTEELIARQTSEARAIIRLLLATLRDLEARLGRSSRLPDSRTTTAALVERASRFPTGIPHPARVIFISPARPNRPAVGHVFPGFPPMPRLIVFAAVLFVLPSARAGEPLRAVIDREVAAAWSAQRITPAARSTDSEFLRRVFIDLVGTGPRLEETTKFLADADLKKREKLIDRLLADPRFATAQADVWDQVLLGRRPGNIDATRKRDTFKAWLANQFADGVPYDRWVKQLLLAEEKGSELFLVQFRGAPEEAAVHVSRIFLGTQLQCARCHDHPYDVWTQKDFYGMAGFFVRLVVQEAGSGNGRTFSIGEKMAGEVLFTGAAKDQQPGKKGEPVRPKFLGGDVLDEPPAPKDLKEPAPKNGQKLPKPAFSRKEKLAAWLASPDNPYLAKAAANRVWAQFMGRGLVHPVDDFQKENAPSHPALLAALTDGLAAHNFDLKWLVREIVNSEAYQLSGAGPVTEALPKFFERARVRPLSAEEIVAALRTATADPVDPKNPNPGGEYWVRYFGEPTNGLGDFQGSLAEHLFANNGEYVRAFARRKKGNLTDQLLTTTDSWEERVKRLYRAVLAREPKSAELEKFVAYIRDDPKPEARVEEAVWVLLNGSEFRFNH